MLEQYGWALVAGMVTLFTLYNTILTIKDRDKRPVDDLRKEFAELERTVGTLTTTLELLNERISSIMEVDRDSRVEFRTKIESCERKIEVCEHQLTEHTYKIQNIEQQLDK